MTYKNHDFPKAKVFEMWKSLNPDWDIEFSDDNDCKVFIENHFGTEYSDLFITDSYSGGFDFMNSSLKSSV